MKVSFVYRAEIQWLIVGDAMKLMPRDLQPGRQLVKDVPKGDSLTYHARTSGIPLGTLKTRVRKLIDKGIDRERAIEIALKTPIGPQGRPRKF